MVVAFTERDLYVAQLRAVGVGLEQAEREATRKYGAPITRVDDDRLEKAIEHDGDVMMQKAGFTVIRFSQARKTKQTPGIPDRRYYRRPRANSSALIVWWEAKSSSGKQSAHQKAFQAMAESCGEAYVCGTDDVLIGWLRTKGLVR